MFNHIGLKQIYNIIEHYVKDYGLDTVQHIQSAKALITAFITLPESRSSVRVDLMTKWHLSHHM